jgi:hypothetical protein
MIFDCTLVLFHTLIRVGEKEKQGRLSTVCAHNSSFFCFADTWSLEPVEDERISVEGFYNVNYVEIEK